MEFFYQTKEFKGLQVTTSTLQKIFQIVKRFSKNELVCKISLATEGKELVTSIAEIDEVFKTVKEQPKHLRLSIHSINDLDLDSRIDVGIDLYGNVVIAGNHDHNNEILSLIWDEFTINDEEYPSFAKTFILNAWIKRLLGFILIGVSIFLITQTIYLTYAKRVGVDLKDKSIIISGNDYYKIVEKAIKSDSITKKLDALLLDNLRGFTNVSEIIEQTKSRITVSSICLLVVLAAYIVLISLRKRFPLVFFNLNELQNKRHLRIIKEREVILISILIAFVINIISGIILSFP